MRTILRIQWLNLKRDYLALGLSFVLPVLFFTISVLAFGGATSDPVSSMQLRVAVIDQDDSELSRRLVAALEEEPAVALVRASGPGEDGAAPIEPAAARLAIRRGEYPAAIVIPAGFGDAFGTFSPAATPIDLIYDASNPLARDMLGGLVQIAAMSAGWDRLMLSWLRTTAGELESEAERESLESSIEVLGRAIQHQSVGSGIQEGETAALVPIRAEDVRGEEVDTTSYSAAGIGVMFLLFSMAGAGGSILEEVEMGTLERLLNSSIKIGNLLMAKWLFFSALAIAQLTVMFIWGSLLFGVHLWTTNRLAGFLAMTCVTAGAAAAFGIFLATICRTRSQLAGISTILILIMSALGGSMVPRFIMPEFMQTVAKFTLNGWALDGYLEVFWYDDPAASLASSLAALLPQLCVLGGLTLILLSGAYYLSQRWATA